MVLVFSWEQLLVIRPQQFKGVVDMLRDGPDVTGDGHEVMISLPAWNNMKVEMITNTCPGNRA